MDLITYYAKFGPKVSRSNGDPSSQKSSSSDATSSQQASVPTVPIIPVHNGRRPDYGFDDTLDSDVEEDDTQEVPHQELLLFIHQMRSPTLAMKAQVTLFNKTHRVECDGCMNRNIECRVTESSQRCQLCTTKRRQCSRTEVLYQWMVLHKFKLSWKKAEEVLKHGQFLARTTKSVKPPKTEAEEQTNVLATSTTVEVRTSPRTPIPRVRKEPAAIAVPIDSPVRAQSGSRKRALLSGSPRADHKRRKVLAPAGPELMSETEHEPAPEVGREILPPPQSERKPRVSEKKKLGRRKDAVSVPALKKPHERLRKTTVTIPAQGEGSGALLSVRVTATEKRLDALEERLQKAELGRERITAQLDRAIGELEGSGDVRGAMGRLRVLRTSLLDSEEDPISIGGGWDPSDGLLIDGEDAQPYNVDTEDYGMDGDATNDLNRVTPTFVDGDTEPEDYVVDSDAANNLNLDTPTFVDGNTERPILEDDSTISAGGPMDVVTAV